MSWKRVLYLVALAVLLVAAVFYVWRFYYPKPVFPLRGEYIKIGDTKLYFYSRGEGRVVLFLHGFPYHSESFSGLLSKPWPGCRLIAADFPGLGFSEKNLSRPVSPEELAMMVKLFLDKLEISSVDLVGHDLGGGVAMILAATYPNLVRRVLLIAPDSSFGLAGASLGWWWSVPGLAELWASFRLDRELIRSILQSAWQSAKGDNWAGGVERYSQPLEDPNGRSAFLLLHRGRMLTNYLPFEERLKNQCQLVWGREDRVVRVAQGEKLGNFLNLPEIRILPGVGHLPQEESPDLVYSLAADFFQLPAETSR